MIDIVEVFEEQVTTLGWTFSYGNAANNNLLSSSLDVDEIYFILDPVTRVPLFTEFGSIESTTFNGQFLLVVKSTIDNNYHNQKGQDKATGKYEKNIKPLLEVELAKLQNYFNCSEHQITGWSIIDAINVLDVNTDGVVVTYSLTTLQSSLFNPPPRDLAEAIALAHLKRVTAEQGFVEDFNCLVNEILELL